jgi:MerR family transcriptional regulator, redox-sensitive transcriptional activator SoxR
MNELSIGQVARAAGMRTSALRYYESVGLLPAPRRVSGQRRYDPAILQTLSLIHMARQIGFSIPEMRALLHGFAPDTTPSQRWQSLATQKLTEIDALIRHAQQVKALLEQVLQCQCGTLYDCAAQTGDTDVGC